MYMPVIGSELSPAKLKETRMKIAYNIIQGFAAALSLKDDTYMEFYVKKAYSIADEILKQGGYDV